MTDILGHDVNGRPLRAGDEVILTSIRMRPDVIGQHRIVSGPSHKPWSDPSEPEVGLTNGKDVQCSTVRKLDNHQSAGSFEEVMAGLRNKEKCNG